MKAILVIDVPENCSECLCEQNGICLAKSDAVESIDRPSWCPLRPMPERKEVHYTHPLFGEVENLTNIGYNKCLDDLGETESDLSTDEGWWKDYELYEMQND